MTTPQRSPWLRVLERVLPRMKYPQLFTLLLGLFVVDLFLEHFALFLKLGELFIGCGQAVLQFRSPAVSDFRYQGQITISFGLLFFNAQLFLLFLDRSDGLDQIFFMLPVGFHYQDFILHPADICIKLCKAF